MQNAVLPIELPTELPIELRIELPIELLVHVLTSTDLLVLDLCFHIIDCVASLDIESDSLSSECLHKDSRFEVEPFPPKSATAYDRTMELKLLLE